MVMEGPKNWMVLWENYIQKSADMWQPDIEHWNKIPKNYYSNFNNVFLFQLDVNIDYILYDNLSNFYWGYAIHNLANFNVIP